MRLVLLIEHEGSYECSGWTETLPIEHENKECDSLELNKNIETTKKIWKEYREALNKWYWSKPESLKPYNGKNPQTLNKHKKDYERYEESLKLWYDNRPDNPEIKEEIIFCGHSLPIYDLEDFTIITLDEWYSYVKSAT